MKLSAVGEMQAQTFDDSHLYRYSNFPMFGYGVGCRRRRGCAGEAEQTHLDEIKAVAMAFGFTPEDIDCLAQEGFSADELEEVLYGYSGEI